MAKTIGDITLYTVLELSQSLDITEVTIRRYIKEGKLKATKIGGKYHISEETLRELLNSGRNLADDIDQDKAGDAN